MAEARLKVAATVRRHGQVLPTRILGDQDLDVYLLAALREVLSQNGHAILADEEIIKGKHAHSPLLLARPVWLSDAARLNALAAPTAERDVSARSVVLDRGGCRLAWIRKDFVGSALQIIF